MANFEKTFKQDCLKYYYEHEGITQAEVAKKFGVKEKTFNKWVKAERKKGPNAFRGSGNYASEEEKEIARFGDLFQWFRKSRGLFLCNMKVC